MFHMKQSALWCGFLLGLGHELARPFSAHPEGLADILVFLPGLEKLQGLGASALGFLQRFDLCVDVHGRHCTPGKN